MNFRQFRLLRHERFSSVLICVRIRGLCIIFKCSNFICRNAEFDGFDSRSVQDLFVMDISLTSLPWAQSIFVPAIRYGFLWNGQEVECNATWAAQCILFVRSPSFQPSSSSSPSHLVLMQNISHSPYNNSPYLDSPISSRRIVYPWKQGGMHVRWINIRRVKNCAL